MKKLGLVFLLIAALSGAATIPAHAQPPIPDIQVGGGQTGTKVSNGQTVEVVTSSGLAVAIYFTEISAERVTGLAVRVSGGSSSGTVTIRWVNRQREVTLQMGPIHPEVPFGMEGGDVDKRSGNTYTP